MPSMSTQPAAAPPRADQSKALALVGEALDKLKFGAVHLTVHEGRLVQIEVTEKIRLTA